MKLLAVRLFSRNKRSAQNELGLREMLTSAVMKEMRELQSSPESFDQDLVTQIFQDMFASRAKEIKTIQESTTTPKPREISILGGTLDTGDNISFLESEIIEEIMRRKQAGLLNTTEDGGVKPSIGDSVVKPDSIIPSPGVVIGVPIPVPSGPPKPIVTVEELPSDDPECRTLATKTCFNTPIIINKKVRSCENKLFVIFHPTNLAPFCNSDLNCNFVVIKRCYLFRSKHYY